MFLKNLVTISKKMPTVVCRKNETFIALLKFALLFHSVFILYAHSPDACDMNMRTQGIFFVKECVRFLISLIPAVNVFCRLSFFSKVIVFLFQNKFK